MPKPGHNYFPDRLRLCRLEPGWGLVVGRRTKVPTSVDLSALWEQNGTDLFASGSPTLLTRYHSSTGLFSTFQKWFTTDSIMNIYYDYFNLKK